MVTINCIPNNPEEKDSLQIIFDSIFSYTPEVNVHVLSNFESPVDYRVYDKMFFIEIPYRKGNYYRSNDIYLNTLCFAIKKECISSITNVDVDDNGENVVLHSEDGELNVSALIKDEEYKLSKFAEKNIKDIKRFNPIVFYCIKTDGDVCGEYGKKVFVNTKDLDIKTLILTAMDEAKFNTGVYCIKWNNRQKENDVKNHETVPSNNEEKELAGEDNQGVNEDDKQTTQYKWPLFISQFIDISGKRTKHSILTQKKIGYISKEKTSKNEETLLENAGRCLCLVKGNAGTGKTLTLLRFMYRISHRNRCRLLTYNNMLVYDLEHTIRKIGDCSKTNVDINTIHSFIYQIFRTSPIRELIINYAELERLCFLCQIRVTTMVLHIEEYYHNHTEKIPAAKILEQYRNEIPKDSLDEVTSFCEELDTRKYTMSSLYKIASDYINKQKSNINSLKTRNAFTSCYPQVLEQLYHLFHNIDEFERQFGREYATKIRAQQESKALSSFDEEKYANFLHNAREKFSRENGFNVMDVEQFFEETTTQEKISSEEEEYDNDATLKKFKKFHDDIKRKLNWPKYLLVDEAQDCLPLEKELLIELFGSQNIVVSSGGKCQLIRTAQETSWINTFGQSLNFQEVKLDYASHRQKEHVATFINHFAEEFSLGTNIVPFSRGNDKGRVIIDLRNNTSVNTMSEQIITELRLAGNDMGCCDYESLMLLFPARQDFENRGASSITIELDENGTCKEKKNSDNKGLKINPFDGMLDCTINDKKELAFELGFNKIRCLFYDSCRGLEAWSVMCIAFDKFFEEKYNSKDADKYANEAVGLDFYDEKEEYKNKYAAIWCFMAMTRPIETLYISLRYAQSDFSQRLLKVARELDFVEIIV